MMHLLSFSMAIMLGVSSNANPVSDGDIQTVEGSPVGHANSDDYRLPENVLPVSYKMLFTPDLQDKFTFHGESEILIEVIVRTNQIVLHANDLTIKMATLTGPNGELIAVKPAALNTTNDFLVINVSIELAPKTEYTLKFAFEGTLGDDGKGFYRISYEDDHGQLRWLAATAFEPTFARRSFPCWDEPHLKATFDISIKHHKDLHAISNMPAITTEIDQTDSTRYVTIFETTPKMSPYIVAFIVTDYESLSNDDGSFRVWAKPSAIQRGQFLANSSDIMLKALEKYTGISYASHGLKKMDAVASFASGSTSLALENWGLVTFVESSLPTAENPSTTNGASIMMHEFAHQWFGNLVSPKWWQYLWLNEGFATYFQYVITDEVWPEWKLKELQVIQCLQAYAFEADDISTSVAMNHDVSSPTEIRNKFNQISYYKAASVIRMIAHVLGEANFQIALGKYLNKMKFEAATPEDLFEELVDVFPTLTGLTVKPIDILNNWVNTPGFPVINVTRDYEKSTVNITQERYLIKADPAHTETYYISINYATEGEKNFDDTAVTNWIDKNKPVTEIEGNFKMNEWVIFNKQQFGYYRVNYDEQNWKMISAFLQSENYTDVHVINRAQLVDDALNLAARKLLRWDVALDLLRFLKQEVDFVPWYPVFSSLHSLWGRLKKTDFEQLFRDYISELVDDVLKNLTFDESLDEDEYRKEFRLNVVELACTVGSKTCRDGAIAKVTNWLEDPREMASLSSDMKKVLLCASARDADQVTWGKLFSMLSAAKDDALLGAIACTSDVEILKSFLSKSIEMFPNSSDRGRVFGTAITKSESGVDVVLDFIITNADRIYEVSGNSTDELNGYIVLLGDEIKTGSQLEKLENASNTHVKNISAKAIILAAETKNWLDSHRAEFVRFFDKNRRSPQS